MDESPILGQYCGNTIPDPVESSGNTMKVVFQSDGSVSLGGFSVTYTSLNEASKYISGIIISILYNNL